MLQALLDAGVDLITPIKSYPDYLLRLLQLNAILALLGYGMKFSFLLINSLVRGEFF